MNGARGLFQSMARWFMLHTLLLVCSESRADFINFDFESAMVPSLPPDGFGNAVPFSNAFPGWTGFYGTNAANHALHNNYTLGLFNISVIETGFPYFPPIEGRYMAFLQSGDQPPGPYLQVAMAQTGTIPTGMKSIEMKVDAYVDSSNLAAELGVTFRGQTIDMYSVQTFPGYRLVRGDVSSLAGLTGELRIGTRPVRPSVPNPYFALDSIRFSPASIPEPSGGSLLFVGGMLIAIKRSRWRIA